MTTLLTGAHGFVGSRIRAHMPVVDAPSLRHASLEDVQRLIDQVQPDVIIHTAAISDIGTCEKNPDASYHANVLIPEYLARAAKDAKLLMFSTDQVYSGCAFSGPYPEDDVAPANLYARHKLEMEKRVLDLSPDAVMLRATWMYDMPMYGAINRGNFLVNMLKAASTGAPMSFSSNQYRGVTWVREVARLIEEAIRLPGGVYNFGSENDLSMLDTALFLRDQLKLKVEIRDSEPRHNLWMDCTKLSRQGIAFCSTTEGLADCIAHYSL